MNDLIIAEKQGFVKPYYIEALGCEGLSAADIAQSLSTQAKHVRQKLQKGWVDNLPEGLKSASTDFNNINEVTFKEFYLSTPAAKLFVSRYQNEPKEITL